MVTCAGSRPVIAAVLLSAIDCHWVPVQTSAASARTQAVAPIGSIWAW
jgi:hypothetical protein